MSIIMEGMMFLMMCVFGLVILGIALAPFYFAYRDRQKVWQFLYSKIPIKQQMLLQAKFTRLRIMKKIRKLGIESQARSLVTQINQISTHDLVQLLENRALLTASCQEAESASKFYDHHDSTYVKNIKRKQTFFEADLLGVRGQINQIMNFLDSLSLSLSELQIKGLPAGDQLAEIISKANDDIAQIIRSQEEVSQTEKQTVIGSPSDTTATEKLLPRQKVSAG